MESVIRLMSAFQHLPELYLSEWLQESEKN